jgi:putative methyltransferase (TIGR04325 family)
MKAALKRLVRALLPLAVHARLGGRNRIRYRGPYPSWAAARAASTGYDAPAILQKVAAATREVVAGRAAFERDSVLFHTPCLDPLLVDALRAAAPTDGSPLRVLDFGGSLGSTYRQLRSALPAALRWDIVEQPAYVECGRREFSTAELHFHHGIADAVAEGPPHATLLASVLPYVETPWNILAEIAALPAATWIVTRTAFSDSPVDHAVVQHVPASIYLASYPAWVLSRAHFAAFWAARGARLAWHPTVEGHAVAPGLAFVIETAIATRQETAFPAPSAL